MLVTRQDLKNIWKNGSTYERNIINKWMNGYELSTKRNDLRTVNKFVHNSSIKVNDKTIRIKSDTLYHCNYTSHQKINLTALRNPKTYSSKHLHTSVLDYGTNICAIVSAYMNGSGGRDISQIYNLLNWPGASIFRVTSHVTKTWLERKTER